MLTGRALCRPAREVAIAAPEHFDFGQLDHLLRAIRNCVLRAAACPRHASARVLHYLPKQWYSSTNRSRADPKDTAEAPIALAAWPDRRRRIHCRRVCAAKHEVSKYYTLSQCELYMNYTNVTKLASTHTHTIILDVSQPEALRSHCQRYKVGIGCLTFYHTEAC